MNLEIRDRAMISGQLSAAVAAGKEVGIYTGHRVERKEIGTAGEFDHLTDEQLERELIERMRAIGYVVKLTERDKRH
jgi:hypothetical protein